MKRLVFHQGEVFEPAEPHPLALLPKEIPKPFYPEGTWVRSATGQWLVRRNLQWHSAWLEDVPLVYRTMALLLS